MWVLHHTARAPTGRAWGLRHLGDLRALGLRGPDVAALRAAGTAHSVAHRAGTRRYSDDDLERLQRITELDDQGVNLAGIAQILDLETRNSQLESAYTQLELLNTTLKADRKPAAGRSAVSTKIKRGSR
jgi:MerR HTH family regulatory protein